VAAVRLRTVVLAVVVLAGVVVAVAGVAIPVAVPVVRVALSMPLVGVVALGLFPLLAVLVVAVRRTVGVGLLADPGLRSRGDASAAEALRGRDHRAEPGARGCGRTLRTDRAGGRTRSAGSG